jgi:peptidoglycan/LPS O-acetylase OafA/YrhL
MHEFPALTIPRPESHRGEDPANYIPELDGIRGIAVLMVIFHHIAQSFPGFAAKSAAQHVLHAWLRITTPGWLGVDVFFALSGFLITGILLDARGRAHYYRNFITRRILRIFPLYYLILLVMFFFYGKPWGFFGLSLCYLANISVLFGVPLIMGPLWSLSVEEHFYVFWPWIVRFLSLRNLLIVSGGLCVFEPVLRMLAFTHGFFNPYFTWFRLDGLACGALIAGIARSRYCSRLGRIATGFIAVSILVFTVSLPFGGATRLSVVGTTLLYTNASLFSAGVIGLIQAKQLRGVFALLRRKTLRFVGRISYCLYLVHLFVIVGFYRIADRFIPAGSSVLVAGNPIAWYLCHVTVVLGTCFLIGQLSMRFYEAPIRRYRVYFK